MIFEVANIWLFLLVLPIIAFLYASVGHGGATGYLALMAIFSFETQIMRPTALVLNLFVAGIAFVQFYRAGHFNFKLFLVFAIPSIPTAFIGGGMELDAGLYKKILAVLLVFAILKMLHVFGKGAGQEKKKIKIWLGLAIGAGIGFVSGLIGIGGGIILSPIILLLQWGKMKEAAAVSALFIWVNSASGLMGQIKGGLVLEMDIFILVGIAFVGGLVGGYFGSVKMNNKGLKYLLATVLISASVKLFIF